MPSANTVAQMAIVVTADTTAVDKSMGDLDAKVKGVGGALSTAFAGAAVAGIAAVGGAFAVSVKSAADFEKQMSAIGAVSGATSEDLDALTKTALQLGKDTSFSAKEAAAGMEEMVKAGVSLEDVMGGGARAALDLAAAGGVEVAEAAEIASNAMNVFNLKGSDMAHVADIIAGAANASAIGVNDYKFSLSAAGAVAATVGVGFEDLSTAIAAMGNAGIKGSDAGTSLKTMLMNLQPTTKAQIAEFERLGIATVNQDEAFAQLKQGLLATGEGQAAYDKLVKSNTLTTENMYKAANKLGLGVVHGTESFERWLAVNDHLGNSFFTAEGKAKSMAEIAEVLKTSMAGLTEQEQLASLEILFGADAVRAAAVLSKQGAEGMNELAASMAKVSAQAVAEERLNNLNGSIEKLMGSLETIAITIGLEMLPVLKDMVDMLTEAANEAMPQIEASAKSFGAALKEWMPTLKSVVGFLWENRDAIAAVVAALTTFAILTTVIGWVTTIAGAISAVTAAISASGGVLAALGALVALLGGPVTLIIAAVALAVGALAYAWMNDWGGIQEKTAAVVEFLSGVPDMIAGFFEAIGQSVQGLQMAVEQGWNAIATATETVWNGIKEFLVDWWRVIAVVLAGPIGALAVLIIDNWETIKTSTETIWAAISNILTAVWDVIYSTIVEPQVKLVQLTIEAAWTAIKEATATAMTAVQTAVETAWTAVSTKTTEVFNAVLAFVRDTIFEPMRAAIETAVNAARDLVNAAWDAISTHAHAVLDPLVAFIRDTIFTPIRTAVETASTGITTAFTDAVTAVKTAVDSTMGAVKTAWETTWGAIERAASSPKAALNEVIAAIEKLKNVMPDWLIPHSPTPFEMGIRGIAEAVAKMNDTWKSLGSAIKGANGEIAGYIANAAAARGIDPGIALRIAQHEGGLEEYNKVGKFATGWSWWPFQLHYGGKGYEHFGTTAGMGNTFTKETGWAPGDPKAWKDSIDYALNHARKYGWSAWYGRGPAGVGAWEGIPGHAAGGWVGLNGPEIGLLGERGPEYIVPNSALRGGGTVDHIVLDVAIDGRAAERIYITGRDLALRRGRSTAGVGTTGNLLAGAPA